MRTLLLAIFLLPLLSYAQVKDRYPAIQSPTETSAMVIWRTSTPGDGILAYGSSPTQLPDTLYGISTSKHAFTISNLLPNTQYYYQASTNSGFASNVEFFNTAKTASQSHFKFLHYGDCGYNNQIQNGIAAQMEQEEHDFAVVAGDVDQGIGDDYDEIFFGVYQDILKHKCHFTALGNHDIIHDNGDTYLDAFYLPHNNAQNSEHYYSFTWGNAKFIALDSNMPYEIGSDQHNFLLDELKCNDRQWLFVFFHHPPWSNAWDPLYYIPAQPYYEYDGNDDMRTELVPFFEQYGVDYVLNGHSHCYQRGIYNNVRYVISGGGGSSLLDSRKCNTFPAYNPCAPNLQVEIYINHYVRFEVNGDSVLFEAIDEAGNVVDSDLNIKSYSPYQSNVSVTQPTAPGASDGQATASASGPHSPYSYSWSNGGNGASITGLSDGTYTVTITDGFGCDRVDTALVQYGLVGTGESLNEEINIKVWPNPYTETSTLNFTNPDHKEFHLELFDLSGKRIRDYGFSRSEKYSIDRRGLTSSTYLLILTSEDQIYPIKVIVE